MSDIQSNIGEFKALAANKNQEPFVMLNLLKFKPEGGRKAYMRYVVESEPFVKGVGAEVIYFGKATEMVYGSEDWDFVMLVRYPSRKAFLQMANDPGYLEVHKYREDGLERAVLYATDPVGFKAIVDK